MDETSEDRLLGGRVRLMQPKAGYRAGADAALLAAACDARAGERVLDVGCGPGAVLLQAAVRRPEARFWGFERDPAALWTLVQLFGTSQYFSDLVIASPPLFEWLRTSWRGARRTEALRDELSAELRALPRPGPLGEVHRHLRPSQKREGERLDGGLLASCTAAASRAAPAVSSGSGRSDLMPGR